MQREITRLSQTIETLKKDASAPKLPHKSPASLDEDCSYPERRYDPPPQLRPYCCPTRDRVAKRKEIEARRFSGKESVIDYLQQFELTAKRNQWDEEEKATSLLCALDEQARGVLSEFEDPTYATFAEVKAALIRRFGPTNLTEIHEQALQQLRLSKGQSIRELALEV